MPVPVSGHQHLILPLAQTMPSPKQSPAKLPWMQTEVAAQTLLEAAKKIERGETLMHGDAGNGARYIERDVVVEALRAMATGRTLGQTFSQGRPPRLDDWKLWRAVADESKRLGSQAAAFHAIAAASGRTTAGVKKSYQRLVAAEQVRARSQFLAGRWPTGYWGMSDADIDQMVEEDGFRYVDTQGQPVDMAAQLRARREQEIQEIKDATGWSELPRVEGQ